MIAGLLALAMVVGQAPTSDRMTWYAGRCPKGVVSLGRTDTCSPYLSKKDGGRGGETRWYAAAGWFRWGMNPVYAVITSKTTGRSIRVLVRDFCGACRQGRVLLDVSPWVFISLGHELGRGVGRITVKYEGAR